MGFFRITPDIYQNPENDDVFLKLTRIMRIADPEAPIWAKSHVAEGEAIRRDISFASKYPQRQEIMLNLLELTNYKIISGLRISKDAHGFSIKDISKDGSAFGELETRLGIVNQDRLLWYWRQLEDGRKATEEIQGKSPEFFALLKKYIALKGRKTPEGQLTAEYLFAEYEPFELEAFASYKEPFLRKGIKELAKEQKVPSEEIWTLAENIDGLYARNTGSSDAWKGFIEENRGKLTLMSDFSQIGFPDRATNRKYVDLIKCLQRSMFLAAYIENAKAAKSTWTEKTAADTSIDDLKLDSAKYNSEHLLAKVLVQCDYQHTPISYAFASGTLVKREKDAMTKALKSKFPGLRSSGQPDLPE